MRAAFGDYRTKMKDEEKKLRLAGNKYIFDEHKIITYKNDFITIS